MNLHVLFFGALAGFAYLQWWALPQAEAAWAAKRTLAKLAKAGSVAALKAVRTVLQIATVVYGLLLAAAWVLDVAGHPASASALRGEIEFLEQLREPLTYIKENIATKIAFGVALFGLAYLVYRRHRADLIARVGARVDSEVERLRADMERSEWSELPPTESMARIRQDLERLHAYAETADDTEKARIAQMAEALGQRWVELDFTRRFDLSEPPTAETSFVRYLWPHVIALLTSRGFVRDSGLPAKGLSYAGTAIMLMSLVGVAGTSLQPQLETRVAHAWELAVSADQADAKQSWNKIRELNKQVTQRPSLPASLHAHNLTRSFVDAYASSAAWHTAWPRPGAPGSDWDRSGRGATGQAARPCYWRD